MRRLLTGFVVAAVTAVVPALALAGNQEIAEQIANRLRNSSQMSDYKIGVKYQDGTAWLRGHVANDEQMKTALRLVFQTASVDRVVNELNVAPSETLNRPTASWPRSTSRRSGRRASAPASYNPLRDQNAAAGGNNRGNRRRLSLAEAA